MTILQRLVPLNMEEEKKKFFFDSHYNPQFVYANPVPVAEMKKIYGNLSFDHLGKAKRIIDAVIEKWKKESVFLNEEEGDVVSREELIVAVESYLELNHLRGKVLIEFSPTQMSAASITGNKLRFRLPIAQRRKRLQGTLDHEIGTHYFRRVNEQEQVWSKDVVKYGLHNYRITEEGLATLNSQLSLENRYLWFTALYYYAVVKANEMSFSQLFEELSKYVDDRERRWRVCLRAKRGMSDTSQSGAFAKDQIYLNGAVQVAEWMKKNDFDPTPLYIGKIAIEDIAKAWTINDSYKPSLPFFIQDKAVYKSNMMAIIKTNGL